MNLYQTVELWRTILEGYVIGGGENHYGSPFLMIQSKEFTGTLIFAIATKYPVTAVGQEELLIVHTSPRITQVFAHNGELLGGIRGDAEGRLKRLAQMKERWNYAHR